MANQNPMQKEINKIYIKRALIYGITIPTSESYYDQENIDVRYQGYNEKNDPIRGNFAISMQDGPYRNNIINMFVLSVISGKEISELILESIDSYCHIISITMDDSPE
ncbi:MAG: hypothetical protein LBI71_00070 [Enterobacteriaceae bacterium]|jgi:hypothetical protein|nr:hypothetical protein [Enterobacteriaceae bacterium]